MKDNMTRILIVLGLAAVLILLFIVGGHADTLGFPFPCYPAQLQQELKDAGFFVDKSSFDRTPESDAYFTDGMSGSAFVIETYYNASPEDLKILHEVVMEHYNKNKDTLWQKPQ